MPHDPMTIPRPEGDRAPDEVPTRFQAYADLWRDAFWHPRGLSRLVARLALLSIHASVIAVVILIFAMLRR